MHALRLVRRDVSLVPSATSVPARQADQCADASDFRAIGTELRCDIAVELAVAQEFGDPLVERSE